jgi:hypothetical protein
MNWILLIIGGLLKWVLPLVWAKPKAPERHQHYGWEDFLFV